MRKKEPLLYERLVDETSREQRVPKGYVPVLVGRGPSIERFFLNVKLFNDPCIMALLDMAVDELGDNREGILRMTCDVDHFRRVVSVISRAR